MRISICHLRLLLLVSIAMLLALAGISCSRADRRFDLSGSEKRYELKGKVVAVDRENQTVTVAHEDIKDFMPGMTMPFVLKQTWPLDIMKPGQELTATLVVDGPRSWLDDVVVTENQTATTTPKTESVVEAANGSEAPDFELVNQDGKKISVHDYRGKALLLTFIYTRCPVPDYCTLMSNNFAQIDEELRKDPELWRKTHLLSISIDPEYDKPAVLRSYGAAHTGRYSAEQFEHWEFAGGTKDQVKEVAHFFGLTYLPDQDQIVHGLRTVIIAPDGKVYKTYRENKWKPEEVVEDLRLVVRGQKSKVGTTDL